MITRARTDERSSTQLTQTTPGQRRGILAAFCSEGNERRWLTCFFLFTRKTPKKYRRRIGYASTELALINPAEEVL